MPENDRMDVGMLIEVVGGLFLLVTGVRQVLRDPPPRPGGVRAAGTVLRVHKEMDDEEKVWLYAPVIAFADERGTRHEFTTSTSLSWEQQKPGDQVTVSYPKGRPEAARLRSTAHSALIAARAGLYTLFILAGLLLLALALPDLLRM
jgi:hypothetical protein